MNDRGGRIQKLLIELSNSRLNHSADLEKSIEKLRSLGLVARCVPSNPDGFADTVAGRNLVKIAENMLFEDGSVRPIPSCRLLKLIRLELFGGLGEESSLVSNSQHRSETETAPQIPYHDLHAGILLLTND
jgi:hypothetical protein